MSRENPNRACGHFEAVYACKPCIEAIRAEMPEFPLQSDRPPVKPGPTSVPWSVADRAWATYSAKYGRSQSVERLAQRAGFSWGEMDMFYPEWREATDEWRKLRAENELLKMKLTLTETERDNYLKAFPEYAATGNELREERARTEAALAEVEVLKKRWTELKAAPFDGEGECGYCHGVGACPRCWGRAGITKLEEKLKDIEDSFRATVRGQCAADEQHCSCVPALREHMDVMREALMVLAPCVAVLARDDRHHPDTLATLLKGEKLLLQALTPKMTYSLMDTLEVVSKAGLLQADCPHEAEPDYCDACTYQRQKEVAAARQAAREVLKKLGRLT